ncbi:DUF2726 domain-containing protein [Vibrio astriarenae]
MTKLTIAIACISIVVYKLLYVQRSGRTSSAKRKKAFFGTQKASHSSTNKRKRHLVDHDIYENAPFSNTSPDTVEHKKLSTLCTENERKFLVVLRNVLPDQLMIHCQTSMLAIVKPVNYKDMSRTWAKRVDFVITDSLTNIVAVIELDDATHQEEKRKKRDLYVNAAISPHHSIVRYPASFSYSDSDVKSVLERDTSIYSQKVS